MKCEFLLVAALGVLLCGSVEATSKSKLIPSKDTYLVGGPDGARVRCASVKGKASYVVGKGRGFIPGKVAVRELAKRLKKASTKQKKKMRAQLVLLKAEVKTGEQVCQGTTGDEPGNPGNDPGSDPGTDPGDEIPTNPTVPASLTKLSRPITAHDVATLVEKAGFGFGADEERLVEIGVTQGVDALVDEFMRTREEPEGMWARIEDRLDTQLGRATTQTPSGQRQGILDLWLHTRNPYAERLAMALLSIWTVSGEVIEDETFRSSFWDYYGRLRSYAHGETNMPGLALEITRDPLMLLYLNNDQNIKGFPNENYARELMELFTVGPVNLDGEPNYTETKLDGTGDIGAAARMLTGWTVKKDYIANKLKAQFDANRHEPGTFTMFEGKPWQFTGENDEDLVQGIFKKHPAVRTYYASELLKLYLTPAPPRELIEAFGEVIAANGYNLRPALRTLLVSEAFYSEAFEDTVPSDPFVMAARVARTLRLDRAVTIGELERQTTKMGFVPNLPPSVFWYPQSAWNSSSVLLEKANLVSLLLADRTAKASAGWTPASVLPTGPATLVDLIDFAHVRTGITAVKEAQRQAIVSYLSKKLEYDGSYVPFTYDNTDPQHQRDKGLGVYFLLFMSPAFQLL